MGLVFAKFARLPRAKRTLLIEAAILLAVARLVPFRLVARFLLRQPRRLPASPQPDSAAPIAWAVGTMRRHTLWNCTCLTQAIAAHWMLLRRGVPSALYLGVAKDDRDELIAHAWVRSGGEILVGANGHDQYTVIAQFGGGIDL